MKLSRRRDQTLRTAIENGLHSRSGLTDRLSTFFLGASGLTLPALYPLVALREVIDGL
jgi:hypothetical protein